jgi:hypothetical protein
MILDLANELLEAQVDRPKQWCRVGAGGVDFLPTPPHGGRHDVHGGFIGKRAV